MCFEVHVEIISAMKRIFVLLLMFANCKAQSEDESCPTGYVGFDPSGNCFKVGGDYVMWIEAKGICENEGGNLAVITSAEEQAFIVDLLKSPHVPEGNYGFYIGLSRPANGAWAWVTEEPYEFKDWYGPNPDFRMDKDACVQIGVVDKQWRDTTCSLTRRYICEFPRIHTCRCGAKKGQRR
ncbi:snaclec B9 [Lingula anatina]|uniref:Snaclec B9 n=1 Tax=Lingula anatina TaxID=7574 RepID=A0A1S3I1I9_LINAN|nr:snaclec B9 [Lingula anatina]|eukprot:XP_013391214.1 snaclec B9 [Lingula anatina]